MPRKVSAQGDASAIKSMRLRLSRLTTITCSWSSAIRRGGRANERRARTRRTMKIYNPAPLMGNPNKRLRILRVRTLPIMGKIKLVAVLFMLGCGDDAPTIGADLVRDCGAAPVAPGYAVYRANGHATLTASDFDALVAWREAAGARQACVVEHPWRSRD